MLGSLNCLDPVVKGILTRENPKDYRVEVDETETRIREGFGARLMAVRKNKGLTQLQVAERFGINKATVSAWEKGRGLPDALMLRRLARLYDVSADSILWENSLSQEAMQVAAWFDSLTEQQQKTYRAVILAFVQEGSAAGEALPLAPDASQPTGVEVGGISQFGELDEEPLRARK